MTKKWNPGTACRERILRPPTAGKLRSARSAWEQPDRASQIAAGKLRAEKLRAGRKIARRRQTRTQKTFQKSLAPATRSHATGRLAFAQLSRAGSCPPSELAGSLLFLSLSRSLCSRGLPLSQTLQ